MTAVDQMNPPARAVRFVPSGGLSPVLVDEGFLSVSRRYGVFGRAKVPRWKTFIKVVIKFPIFKGEKTHPRGRITVDLKAFRDAAGLGRWECHVQQGYCVNVKVVTHKNDPLGQWEIHIGQIAQNMGIVGRVAPFSKVDCATACQRCKEREKVGYTCAFIFVVDSRFTFRAMRQRHGCLSGQLH